MMAMSASLLQAGDVVVAFSHSGRTTGVLEATQIAKLNGAHIIALTNYESSPLADMADVVLVFNRTGIATHQRKCRGPHRATEHHGRHFYGGGTEELQLSRGKPVAHHVSGEDEAAGVKEKA